MWQCLPVKKDIVRIAPVSLLIALITAGTAAHAQSNYGINTVSSVREDRTKTAATISTVGKQPLPRPIIQFLPGENGTTIMVADFPDVVFPHSTKVITVNAEPLAMSATAASAPSRGIKLVRIGRFQESPPIFRVAIVSTDAEKLRSVRFNAKPGALSVHWSKSPAVSQKEMPPVAPASQRQPARRRAYQTTFTPPPVAPPVGTMEPSMLAVPQVGQAYPSKIDPEVASSYLPLRPPLPQPVINSAPQGLVAKAERLHPKGSDTSKKAFKVSRLENGSQSASIATAPPPSRQLAKGVSEASAPRLAYSDSTPGRLIKKPGEKQSIAEAPRTKPDGSPQLAPTESPTVGEQAPRLNPALSKLVPPQPKSDSGYAQKNGELIGRGIESAAQPAKENEGSAPSKRGVMSFYSRMKEKAQVLLQPENSAGESAKPNPASMSAEAGRAETETASLSPPSSQETEPALVPEISLSPNGSGGYTLKITSPKDGDLNYTSFRLHNPERFVIDLDNMRGIQSAVVPQPDNSDYLTAVRAGAPDPVKNTGRLVLDLKGENVSVIPSDSETVNVLSFVVGKSDNPVSGIVPPPGSVLVIDAGHGGNDPGAQRGFVKEKDLTLAIAQKTRDKLAESGVKVVMTRDEDSFISLSDRVAITNNLKPDLFLSVHINSLESTSDIHGIETYYQSDISKPLAQSIHEAIVSELQAPDRAIRKAKFYVINRAQVPAVLAEVGFISNKSERDKLVSADYQEKIAGALAKGAILYLKQSSSVARKLSSARPAEDIAKGDNSTPGSATTADGSTLTEGTAPQEKDSTTALPSGSVPGASRLAQKALGIKSH